MEPAAEWQAVALHSASTDHDSWLLLWTIMFVLIQLCTQCLACCEVIVSFQKACNQVHMPLKRILSRPLVMCTVALMLRLVFELPALSCLALCAKSLLSWLVPRKALRSVCRARVIGSRRVRMRRCQVCGDWVRIDSLVNAVCLGQSGSDSASGLRSRCSFASSHSGGNCFVKTLNGCTLVVPLHASSCIRDIAGFVSNKTAVPVKLFYLALSGRVLRHCSFCADAGVHRDCHIMMCARLRGGGKPRSGSATQQQPARSDSAPAFDPWAAYASASRQTDDDVEMPEDPEPDVRRATTVAQVGRPSRAKWEDLQVAGDQFEPTLTCLPNSDVRVGAHGFALVRREQIQSLLQVTSSKNIALIVPGHGDKGFDELALKAKRIKGTIVVTDPQLKRKELKDVSIFSIGSVEIALKTPGSDETFAPQPTVEIAMLAARSNFDDESAWAHFVANARSEFRRIAVSSLASEHCSRLEMYAFKKISDTVFRVIVRVPQSAALDFLTKSAVSHALVFQAVWRDDVHKEFLDKSFCVVWMGTKALADARALLPRLSSHHGLQMNRSGFGVRVPVSEVANARKVLKPADSRFDDTNRHLVGRLRYFAYGFPDGTSRSEVSQLLHDKLKLPALVGAPQRRGGHLVFPVAVDAAPAKDTFELSTGPVLLRSALPVARSPPVRGAGPKPSAKPQAPRVPVSRPPTPAPASSSDASRINTLEQRLAELEARSQDQEARTKSLEGKVDACFAQVLAKLNSLQPAAPTAVSGEESDFAEAVRQSLRQGSGAALRWHAARAALQRRVPCQFKLSHVPGDGNCLFEAVARAANYILPSRFSSVGLRRDCVQALREVSEFQGRFSTAQEQADFCDAMSRNGTYGDELCVRALSHVLQLVICVHSPEYDPLYFGVVGPCIHVGYNGFNHYDAVIPRLPACPSSNGFVPSPLIALPAPSLTCASQTLPPGDVGDARGAVDPDVPVSLGSAAAAPSETPCVQHHLKIISANITSWNTRHQVFSPLDHHVLCFQETRLNDAASARAVNQVRSAGKRLVCGKPVSQQGGVAIQTPSPLQLVAIPKPLAEWDLAGRVVAAWVPLASGHRCILVISVYGIAGSHPQKNYENFVLNEKSLSAIFEWLSSFGDAPCFLCGDFNIDPSLSPACLEACASGRWHDLGAESGSLPTFEAVRHGNHASSRIDAIFCNKSARAAVSHFEVVELDIPNHKALQVTVKLPPFSASVLVLRHPKPLPLKQFDDAQIQHAEEVFALMSQQWQQCLKLSQVDEAWELLCRKCCLAFREPASPLGPETFSHGREPRLPKRLAFPPQSTQGSCSVKVLRLFKLQRRVQEALPQRAKLGFVREPLLTEVQRGICSLRLLHGSDLHEIAACIRNEIDCEQQHIERTRINAWKSRLQTSWSGNKTEVFKWLRLRKTVLCVPEFLSQPSGLCASPQVLLQKVIEKWSGIYNCHADSEPSWDTFWFKYYSFFRRVAVKLPAIDPDELRRIACGGGRTAAGLDNWSREILKCWPSVAWAHLTQLLELVERSGRWPSNLLHILVTLIPKPHGLGPDDLRPISIASLIYRSWASLRAKHLKLWQAQWAPAEIFGGVADKRVSDLYLRVATELEHALSGGSPSAVLLLDLSKFFDRLPWSIEYNLLTAFGCPDEVVLPKRDFATRSKRWFRMGAAVSQAVTCRNGTPQGCPLSILSVNALMSVWSGLLRQHVPELRAGAFIDDRSLRTADPDSLQSALTLTDQFDTDSGSSSNQDKTKLLVTSFQLEQAVAGLTHGPFPVCPSSQAKLLGVSLSARATAHCEDARERTEAAIDTARRVQFAPLHFDARQQSLSSACLPKWVYGIEVGGHPLDSETRLRNAVAEALNFRRSFACRDVFLALCCKGELVDPHQIRPVHVLLAAQQFLRRCDESRDTWIALWHARAGATWKGRFGMAAQVQRACEALAIHWASPYELQWDGGSLSLLHGDASHFRFKLRDFARTAVLKRAAKRPCLHGVADHVDAYASTAVLHSRACSSYDKGVMRSILCNGVLTQHALHAQGTAPSSLCPFCNKRPETLLHLYWCCPRWDDIRANFQLPDLSVVQQWLTCTQLCGVFQLPDCIVQMRASLEAETFCLPKVAFPDCGLSVLPVWVDGSVFHREDARLTRAGSG
ncbi:Pol, partial [Symbiodinium sp. CCMP2592]